MPSPLESGATATLGEGIAERFEALFAAFTDTVPDEIPAPEAVVDGTDGSVLPVEGGNSLPPAALVIPQPTPGVSLLPVVSPMPAQEKPSNPPSGQPRLVSLDGDARPGRQFPAPLSAQAAETLREVPTAALVAGAVAPSPAPHQGSPSGKAPAAVVLPNQWDIADLQIVTTSPARLPVAVQPAVQAIAAPIVALAGTASSSSHQPALPEEEPDAASSREVGELPEFKARPTRLASPVAALAGSTAAPPLAAIEAVQQTGAPQPTTAAQPLQNQLSQPAATAGQARPLTLTDLVDSIAQAREAALPHRAELSVRHSDFGRVSIRMDAAGAAASLGFTLSSADAGFSSAAQAALADRGAAERVVVAAQGDQTSRQAEPNASGQGGSNGASSQQATSGGTGHPAHRSPAPAHDPARDADVSRADENVVSSNDRRARGGIFA
ncbi:hypothetical protein AAW00_13980 [Aurantiacibacter luteus]|uniref:Uncharacterized protein n=2 Tax=Aurantiacibacter luteus TaxID=1581420 RepID=A0A0G9MKK9_9SPHN|nr:hypothetical protein AAW00_13980 [Aurantiacibacter luteus]